MIEFGKTFGQKNTSRNNSNNTDDRPKAQVWMNIGYTADVCVKDEEKPRFISLPVGIPVDTQEHVSTNSSDAIYSAFQASKNDLLDEIMAVAAQLEPGETVMLDLQVELRRVAGERETVAPENNPFKAKGLTLVKTQEAPVEPVKKTA